jgi:long-chain acyl-CoA synthetase
MLGYWNLPEATRAAVDASGWLHTGDLAEVQAGNVYIRGRMKEILVTSGGEKVPPADMELAITADPLFEQAMVIGENRPYLAALLVLNAEAWHTLATHLELDPNAPASLQSRLAKDTVLARIHELLRDFPRYAQVRKIYLTRDDWTIENGLVTPTLKIKRHALEQRYAVQIHSLYPRPEPAESSVYRTL